MRPTIVTLLTDFGLEDSYVAEMKGVILSSLPGAQVVDITHSVPPFDTRWGAFQLMRTYDRFPQGTIHLAVVDPGVGSSRKCLYGKTARYHFVGPDNGLLFWAVDACRRQEKRAPEWYEIPVDKKASPTFHGRDVFAPFVAKLLWGQLGPLKKVKKVSGSAFPICRRLAGKVWGEIIGADRFGNIVTSIPIAGNERGELEIPHHEKRLKVAPCYERIPGGECAIIRGSHGFWEIAMNQGSAWERLKLDRGERVALVAL